MKPTSTPIVIAAGGTGGHIFPAEALAEVLHARGNRVVLMTDKRFAKFNHGIFIQTETLTVRSGSLSGKPLKKLVGVVNLTFGIVQAALKLFRLRPQVVVGFGGYPSFPTMIAATLLRIPTVIHEQNAVLGRANRLLAHRVTKIATSFPQTLMVDSAAKPKLEFIGNPVRAGVRAVREVPYPALTQDGILQILVTGGSQGASVFSDVVPAAIGLLPQALQARIRIDQQCRPAEIDAARAAYAALGASVYLTTFFTDMPSRLASCHLVIARSGASTVAELTIAGRPAILVPYPSAMDNHQYYNANAFEDAGGGWVMAQEGFTAAALAARLESLLGLPSTLIKAAEAARAAGNDAAAAQLARLSLEVAA
jgi:UDP-N-acetylglucosamine--N-acetylmuramyl-(pentapeptide) pyrophosphoryl-undecaprenol N-acetylglucosamine transferase